MTMGKLFFGAVVLSSRLRHVSCRVVWCGAQLYNTNSSDGAAIHVLLSYPMVLRQRNEDSLKILRARYFSESRFRRHVKRRYDMIDSTVACLSSGYGNAFWIRPLVGNLHRKCRYSYCAYLPLHIRRRICLVFR